MRDCAERPHATQECPIQVSRLLRNGRKLLQNSTNCVAREYPFLKPFSGSCNWQRQQRCGMPCRCKSGVGVKGNSNCFTPVIALGHSPLTFDSYFIVLHFSNFSLFCSRYPTVFPNMSQFVAHLTWVALRNRSTPGRRRRSVLKGNDSFSEILSPANNFLKRLRFNNVSPGMPHTIALFSLLWEPKQSTWPERANTLSSPF